MFHPLAISVHDLWQQALYDPLRLGCCRGDEGQIYLDEKEAGIVDPMANYDAANSALSIGLSLHALNVDISQADRWIAVGRERGARVRNVEREQYPPVELKHRSPYRMEALTCWAVGLSAASPVKPPDAALLEEGARLLHQYLIAERIQFDELYRTRIFFAAISALAAQNLELARSLVNLRTTMPGSHYKWLKAICKGAAIQSTPDGPRIRIAQPKAVAAFFDLYNAYRLPDLQTSWKLVGRTDMYMYPVIGNYLLSWVYLQSVTQEAPATVDWPLLGELMTS
jgi:hypothetical protein